MKKLKEETSGNHIYMRLQLDNGAVEEISVYCGSNYKWNHYKTTADHDENRRSKIIKAFKELY